MASLGTQNGLALSPVLRSLTAPRPPWEIDARSSRPDTSVSARSSTASATRPSDDKLASFGGHGTLEILKVTQVLEGHDIPCCLTGTSALIYYGADRTRNVRFSDLLPLGSHPLILQQDWEVCVSTEQLESASLLLQSDLYQTDYSRVDPSPVIQLRSLLHTFPRFKCQGLRLYFVLVPSEDAHVECHPSKFQRSLNGLPYPKLDVFIQSLLDTHDMVALCDVIDGCNVSEEWGNENLQLEGSNDLDWVRWKNRKITEANQGRASLSAVETAVYSRRKVWEETVRGKSSRLGFKHEHQIALFATRFRLHGSVDPWLRERTAA